MPRNVDRSSIQLGRWRLVVLLLTFAMLLSGCNALRNLIGSSAPEPTATPEPRILIATFTPTPILTATPVPPPTEPPAQVVAQAPAEEEEPATEADAAEPAGDESAPAVEPTQPPPTEPPVAEPKLAITGPSNLRSGPGTTYGIVGAANPGDSFDVVGKSPDGAWWQICCINGQQAWVFGQLTQPENVENVQVAQNIPAPPPPPPTAVPAPVEPTAPPAPPPSADPCAGIGGDGCKWKKRQGPSFGGSSNELRLQIGFFHGGRGDEAQGSYFVVLTKDGQTLNVPDSVRSRVKDKQNGSLGPYNYEFKTGTGSLPGNTVAGNYELWVLDGNGERDSRNIQFSVPDGQGLVWMILDQN